MDLLLPEIIEKTLRLLPDVHPTGSHACRTFSSFFEYWEQGYFTYACYAECRSVRAPELLVAGRLPAG
jgi:hypothetical protein